MTASRGPAQLVWCEWHEGPVTTALKPQWATGGSGPGVTLQACAACRFQRHHPEETPAGWSTAADWCHWHEGPTGIAVLINVIDRDRLPDLREYACAPCREQFGLLRYEEVVQL